MASYTENYQLHQWEPEDNFLRTDFNQDFARLDAALRAAEDRAAAATATAAEEAQAAIQELDQRASAATNAAAAEAQAAIQELDARAAQERQSILNKANRALSDLERQGYNLYNLLLQQQYDSKVSGYRKALIFDGFQDEAGIASLSSGFAWYGPKPSLLLDTVGQSEASYAYGTGYSFTLSKGQFAETDWTATGNGNITTASMYIQGKVDVSLWSGKTMLKKVTVTSTKMPYSFSFPFGIRGGQDYTFRLDNPYDGTVTFARTRDYGTGFAFKLTMTPVKSNTGTLVSTPYTLDFSAARAVGWVRHSGGTAQLALRQNSGSWKAMTASGTRSTLNLYGDTCTESAFALDSTLSGSQDVRVILQTTSGNNVYLFDYGVVFL